MDTNPGGMKPAEVLQQFIAVFADKGWINQSIRIKYGVGYYRVLCDENGFIAYRVNDNWGISHGAPGWPVCIIDQNRIVENMHMSQLAPTEPSALDWLNCLVNGNIEVI